MPRTTRIAVMVGAALGATIGLGVVAFASGRVLDAGIGFGPGPSPAPSFVVGQAGMYVLVAIAGAIGGAVLGLIGYAVGREADPDARRFPAAPLALVSAGIGSAVGFGVFRAAAGILGDIIEGQVVLTVFRAIMVALISGAVMGAVCAGAAERLSRPEVFGFAGDAWPASPAAFIKDATAAIGLPVLGLVVGASAVYVFSQVLLNSETDVATTLFGGVAALILLGAAVVAAMGSRRSRH